MLPPAHVTVLIVHFSHDLQLEVTVPTGTPAGGVWGHLPDAMRAGGPPAGVRYRLNGIRTIPGAPLRDGDTLEIAAPHEEER